MPYLSGFLGLLGHINGELPQ